MVSGHDVIRVARTRRGMTQLDIALSIGACERQIRRWETGEMPVPFNIVRNISALCGMNLIELLTELTDENHQGNSARA